MFDNERTLKWSDGILKFPCGVTVELDEKQLKKLLTAFKLESEIDNMINNGSMTIAKGRAFQIKHHLT
jgi:hypothetical protein